MKILYLAFGQNRDIYLQVHYSALTFLAKNKDIKICVATDQVSWFSRLNMSENVELCPISPSELNEWKGKHDFFLRIKLKAMQRQLLHSPEDDMLYIDGDTFCGGDISSIEEGMKKGCFFMHINEGLLQKNWEMLWRRLEGKIFDDIEINERTYMWNSGVVGLPAIHGISTINRCLTVCDQLCEELAKNSEDVRLMEQLAMSLVLQKMGELCPADKLIGHYWGNKEYWNQIIANSLSVSLIKGNSLQDDISELNRMSFDGLPLVIIAKKKPVNLLTRLTNKLYPRANEVELYFRE